ncbi:hypothetical protein INT47_010023 [Mucor saturninus]|uniref:JmjC domain-containing histone demethylation protein 1 n=1 Tax=Mucor saturninus TaxID=64648 RepID=A0A8H7QND7_9FUNG|nr:hypothetical protein INT47_010023 [Mucor saturninus]
MNNNKDSCPSCESNSVETSNDYDTWLQCDACPLWYHAKCLEIKKVEIIERFHCPQCIGNHGPSTFKPKQRKSNRSHDRLNYADLNEGTAAGDERIWGKLLRVKKFRKDHFKRYQAKDVNMELLRKTGMREPFVVQENEPELDMEMPPPDVTVHTIAELVGKDTLIDVIDVASQSEIHGWTLSRWADYFHTTDRDRIRNVISLEISGTDFAKHITRPKIVRDLDWIDQVWPATETEHPKVQLYCLMGTKDSYTDFHIDFGGSSVFYHILRGSKTFYFIEPTDKNLKKYQRWSSSSEQSTTFLGDLVKDCYSVELQAGNTMIIPTGWIHAVYTPEDAIVIGGNFLHSLNTKTQLKVYDIEEATDVPMKFRFPYYKKINWYALEKSGILLDENNQLSKFEYESIVELARFLRQDLTKDSTTIRADGSISHSNRKLHQVPETIVNPIALTERVEKLAKKALEALSEKPKNIIRLVLNVTRPAEPPQIPHPDDYEYENEEYEEDEDIDEDIDEEDEEYQEDSNVIIEHNTLTSVFNNNDHVIKSEKKIRKKKKITAVTDQRQYDSSSDDEDRMGTTKSKKISLFTNRKRSLSNNSNSSQPSTAKQRILGVINKRY